MLREISRRLNSTAQGQNHTVMSMQKTCLQGANLRHYPRKDKDREGKLKPQINNRTQTIKDAETRAQTLRRCGKISQKPKLSYHFMQQNTRTLGKNKCLSM